MTRALTNKEKQELFESGYEVEQKLFSLHYAKQQATKFHLLAQMHIRNRVKSSVSIYALGQQIITNTAKTQAGKFVNSARHLNAKMNNARKWANAINSGQIQPDKPEKPLIHRPAVYIERPDEDDLRDYG